MTRYGLLVLGVLSLSSCSSELKLKGEFVNNRGFRRHSHLFIKPFGRFKMIHVVTSSEQVIRGKYMVKGDVVELNAQSFQRTQPFKMPRKDTVIQGYYSFHIHNKQTLVEFPDSKEWKKSGVTSKK